MKQPAYQTHIICMKTNTKHKDSVFSLLFNDPDLLRELYCALENVNLPPDIPVFINTLKDVLYMDMFNDISFVIGNKLVVLIEHQSTINPNMALRLLMYIARVYEKIIDTKNLYSSKLLSIPKPEFFVLYNGKKPYPDEQILRLSDMFNTLEKLGLPEKPLLSLELNVRVININEGRNIDIASRCRKLSEYSAFIAKVREFEKKLGDKSEAMKAAIKYCLNHDILKEFIQSHASEVENMLITEWNTEEAKQVWYEEGLEDGEQKGLEKGREKEREAVAKNALERGLSIGIIHEITGLDIKTIEKLGSK